MTLLETIKQQVEYAKSCGIDIFAFYYYSFNGKRILEKPIDIFLESNIKMQFILIWANENWTRTWDGLDTNILLKQEYLEDFDSIFLEDLARHMRDERYFRIEDRPLFIIYRPGEIPNALERIKKWRKQLKQDFSLNPLIFMAQGFDNLDPKLFQLDGAIEFPPHKLASFLPGRPTPDAFSTDFQGRVIKYEDFIKVSLAERPSTFPLIKTVVPSWDNDARRPGIGFTLEEISPNKYQNWLYKLLLQALNKPIYGMPLVAINAWNEWAEAAYLEPDIYYGSAFLNATARAKVAAINE